MVDSSGVLLTSTIRDRTLADQIVRGIRRDIMLGVLQPGQRLREVQLSEQLGVSRGTIREALRRLEAEHLVESFSHRGSRVACLTSSDAVEVCQLHAMLETWCVERLSIPIAPVARERLDAVVQQMRTLVFPAEADRFIDLDHEFHRIVVAAALHRWALEVWSNINSLLGVIVTLSIRYLPLDASTIADRHQCIVDALVDIENGQAGAIEVVKDHYDSLASRLQQHEPAARRRVDGGA
jgi:DNA-binding GntR family transcriptional regulator